MGVKNLLGMAALSFMAVVTSCSSDDIVDTDGGLEEVQPKLIPFSATIGPKDESTRSLLEDGENKIITTWTGGEQVAVVVNNRKYLTTVKRITGAGYAIIEGQIDGNVVTGQPLDLYYPYSAVQDDGTIKNDFWRDVQGGTLSTINGTANIAKASGTIVVEDGKSATMEKNADFTNLNAICRFKFQDENGKAITNISKLVIHLNDEEYSKEFSVKKSGEEDDFYVINLARLATPTEDNVVYLAMEPIEESTELLFHVKKEDGTLYGQTYEGTATVKRLLANRYYPTTLKVNAIDQKAVSLGVRTKWAGWNLGAESPEDFGDYFAWGDPKGYNRFQEHDFSWATYVHSVDGNSDARPNLIKYVYETGFGNNKAEGYDYDDKYSLDAEDDAAIAYWGESWRMPTEQDWKDFLPYVVDWDEDGGFEDYITTYNGVDGVMINPQRYGYKENFIFLPAAGIYGSNGPEPGLCAYWTTTLSSVLPSSAMCFICTRVVALISGYSRDDGRPIRAIYSPKK